MAEGVNKETIRAGAAALLQQFDGDKEFTSMILNELLTKLPLEAERLHKHISSKQWKEAGTVVHQLKGSLRLLGLADLMNRAAKLEYNLKEFPATRDVETGQQISKEVLDVCTLFHELHTHDVLLTDD